MVTDLVCPRIDGSSSPLLDIFDSSGLLSRRFERVQRRKRRVIFVGFRSSFDMRMRFSWLAGWLAGVYDAGFLQCSSGLISFDLGYLFPSLSLSFPALFLLPSILAILY